MVFCIQNAQHIEVYVFERLLKIQKSESRRKEKEKREGGLRRKKGTSGFSLLFQFWFCTDGQSLLREPPSAGSKAPSHGVVYLTGMSCLLRAC